MLRLFISKGANTRVVSIVGNNLLHDAIFSLSHMSSVLDMETVVEILVNNGCDAFALNSGGKTPLHLAVEQKAYSVVEYLLSLASVPDLPADLLTCALDEKFDWYGPLASMPTLMLLRLLIGKGANTLVRAADGSTLLHMAIKNCK